MTEDAAGYEFAAMRIDDYDAVAALWGRVPGMGRIETREELAFFLDRNPSLSQVALYGGQVVAAVLAGHDGRRGYLYHLAVALNTDATVSRGGSSSVAWNGSRHWA